jgi:hypothetical protein
MMSGIAVAVALGAMLAAAEVEDVDYAWATAVLPSGSEFSLEVADTPQSRWRGYRYREHVAADEGMLFIFSQEQPLSFEMRDCLVPLDMIFLDSKLLVVEIARDRQPCVEGEPCPPIVPMRSAKYVLELAGGTTTREGLQPGDRVTILSEPSIP